MMRYLRVFEILVVVANYLKIGCKIIGYAILAAFLIYVLQRIIIVTIEMVKEGREENEQEHKNKKEDTGSGGKK